MTCTGKSAEVGLSAAALSQLSKELTDAGKLIEAGFAGLRAAALHPMCQESQLREMRMAFFAGAQHLFSSVMTILDPGEEPTEDDMTRMTKIHEELQTFIKEFEADYLPGKA